jgi:hypothetical protein
VSHFTYVGQSDTNLQQGDLLAITPELKALLLNYHSYYGAHPDYHFLLILTQTCDLARRNSDCKSPYVTVAAVRSLLTVLRRQLSAIERSETARQGGFSSEGTRKLFEQFVEHLLNNNEPGYFYLHEEHDTLLTEPHVAFLTLSVALKREHYEKCLAARVLSLKPEFQAKLGWLVGNLYSRVATKDWTPDFVSPPEFEAQIDEVVRRLGVVWIQTSDFERVKARVKHAARTRGCQVSPDLAQEIAEQVAHEKDTRRERAAARASAILQELGMVVDPDKLDQYRRQLTSDQEFKQSV